MKITLIIMMLLAIITGCTTSSTSKDIVMKKNNLICNNQNLAGGWSKTQMTPESNQALDFAIASMNTKQKLAYVTSVYSQTVNGVNYAIEFEMEDSKIYHAIVYRALSGDMTLTQPAQHGNICS
ncbi:cystatin domain-containing protein [Shewanella maritima]|nr:cystatin domain-containing protein [Shewanella maritima]